MDPGKFKDVEEKYRQLKERLDQAEITPDDLKRELKKLIVMDESGRYWMIGTKSGQWHMYDGTDWKVGVPYETAPTARLPTPPPVAPAPPPPPARLAVPPADHETVSCVFCQKSLPAGAAFCPACGGNQRETVRQPRDYAGEGRGQDLTLRGVRVFSLAAFLGGIGLIFGVIVGASFGIFKFAPEWIKALPILLRDAHGQVQGGLLFGAVGGIGGYLTFALLGILLALFYNFIAFVFGGIRFRTR